MFRFLSSQKRRLLLLFILSSVIHFSCDEKKTSDSLESKEQLFVSSRNGLNLRSIPGNKGKIISTIPYGTPVTVLEKTGKKEQQNGVDGEWIKIQYEKNSGYAFGGFLISYEEYEANQGLLDLQKGDVKPYQFSPIGKSFSYGRNCSGLTYSEYFIELNFENDQVQKTYVSANEGEYGFGENGEFCPETTENTKKGKYSIEKNILKIEYYSSLTKTTDCKSKIKENTREKIQESEILDLVSCKGKPGFRIQNSEDPDFFYTLKN